MWRKHADAFALNEVGAEALLDKSSPTSDQLLYDLGMTKAEVKRLRKYLNHRENDDDGSTGRTVALVLEAAGFESKSWRRHAEAFTLNEVGVEALLDKSSPNSDQLLYDLGMTKSEVKRLRKYLNHCDDDVGDDDSNDTKSSCSFSLDRPPTIRS